MADEVKTPEIVRPDYEQVLFQSRIIFLYGVINEASAKEVNQKLMAFRLMDKDSPVVIEICSGGGECMAGIAIADMIHDLGTPVYTIINGYAASIATYIAIVGHKRFMTSNSYWMGHPMTSGKNDYLPYLKDDLKFIERLNETLLKVYKKYADFSDADIQKMENGELWLNAKECLKRKIVDKIS